MFKRKIIYLLVVSLLVTSRVPVLANVVPEASYPQNLSSSENAFEYLFLEEKGALELSTATKELVLAIAKELNIDKPPRMRKANPSFSKGGACMWLDCLFIDEEWFNRLPDNQKRALIGHELIHYKHNHVYKSAPIALLILLAGVMKSINTLAGVMKRINNFADYPIFNDRLAGVKLPTLPWQAMLALTAAFCAQSRHYEREADITSAKQLACAHDSIKLMETLKKENEDPESRFKIKRDFNAAYKSTIGFFFSTHPSLDTRIEYLRNLV